MTPLSDILKQFKSSAAVPLLEKDLKDLKENVDEIIEYLRNRLSSNSKQKTEAIQNIRSMHGNYIEDLKRGSDLHERNLHVKTSPALASILHNVKSFGEITVDTRPCNVQANAERKDQAQYLVPVPTIDQIKPSFSNKLNVPIGRTLRIVDCCILPDCNCLIVDTVGKDLLLFKNDGTFIRAVLSFENTPDSVCFVKDGTVAVSFYRNGEVALVDIYKSQVDRNFMFPKVCCSGVSSDGQVLVISMPNEKKVIVMNLLDESKQKEGIYVNHISLVKGNIYGSNFFNKTVKCYTLSGELLWTFKHENIDKPSGIALDKHGFIYVACRISNKIVVFSPDGKSCRTILNREDGMKAPQSIAIDIKSETMLVSSSREDLDPLLFKL
ncbi:unnamed protein product [Mytilus coruscus]|uniref:Uncharacterized protein n=1 Tax=Mytilus coruscus TaxID=42192 RepID=A0A6J8AVT7_MYTCO|nr:unnamed protein product [Mytilus coruscus]